MRPHRSIAVLAIALLCPITEPARAAPVAAAPLLDSIGADRGSPMFNANRNSIGGETALRLLTDDVNAMLRGTEIDAEREMIRKAGDLALEAIGDSNTADHAIMYAIAGSVRETGFREISVAVSTRQLRNLPTKQVAKHVEPWTPRSDSPTRASRAEREGSSERSSEANASEAVKSEQTASGAKSGARSANSG